MPAVNSAKDFLLTLFYPLWNDFFCFPLKYQNWRRWSWAGFRDFLFDLYLAVLAPARFALNLLVSAIAFSVNLAFLILCGPGIFLIDCCRSKQYDWKNFQWFSFRVLAGWVAPWIVPALKKNLERADELEEYTNVCLVRASEDKLFNAEKLSERWPICKEVDGKHQLIGIFTDGDLRRVIDRNIDVHQTLISDVMTKNCKTITTGLLAAEALNIMENYKITSLVITDSENAIIGVIHLHDLLQAELT